MNGNRFNQVRADAGFPQRMFRKGDRVCWRGKDDDGNVELKYGTVTRGGKRIVATMDGGEYEVNGSPNQFRHSDKPLPKDPPSPMDDYSVSGYKTFPEMSDETVAFRACVSLNGKPILTAKNDGHGGDTEIWPIGGFDAGRNYNEVTQKFLDDAKAWAIQFGQTSPFESFDEWIDWYVNHRPYGVTAADFNRSIEKRMAEIRG